MRNPLQRVKGTTTTKKKKKERKGKKKKRSAMTQWRVGNRLAALWADAALSSAIGRSGHVVARPTDDVTGDRPEDAPADVIPLVGGPWFFLAPSWKKTPIASPFSRVQRWL